MAGEKDDRQGDVGIGELSLKFEAAQSREAHVEDETAGSIPSGSAQERLSVREHLHRHAYRAQEATERLADRPVVVDHEDDGGLGAHRFRGNARWNVTPWCGFAVNQSRPRWLSTIERLIDKPMPRLSGFVV